MLVAPKSRPVSFGHFQNVPDPTEESVPGSAATLTSEGQLSNAFAPIDCRLEADASIEVSPLCLKALAPIVCRLDGMDMVLSAEQPE